MPHRPAVKAFTLVELLVVIGIIALLISILLPVLNRARAAAQSIACGAQLRSIGQAMQMYASQHNGMIIGTGHSTGRGLLNASASGWAPGLNSGNVPPGMAIHPLDWLGPVARQMGIRPPPAIDDATDERERFKWYATLPQFICPSYGGVTAIRLSSGQDAGPQQAVSYTTAVLFSLGHAGGWGYAPPMKALTDPYFPVLPTSYSPRLPKVKNSAAKIFMADGSKNLLATFAQPTYDLSPRAGVTFTPAFIGYTTNWTDFGPWTQISSYRRSHAPGNTASGPDARHLAFRHGSRRAGGYKLNALFFDGHVETLGELEASDPALWMPTGTTFGGSAGGGSVRDRMWPDVVAKYNVGSPYVAP